MFLNLDLGKVLDSAQDAAKAKIADAKKAVSGGANAAGEAFTSKLVSIFRGTPTGQSLEAEAVKQKFSEIFSSPINLALGAAAVVLLVLGVKALVKG